MTKAKVIEVLNTIKTTYYYAYKDFTKQQFLDLCTVWYECLKSFTDEQVSKAVQVALMEHSNPPVPADIVVCAKKLILLEQPTDNEYWNELMTAVEKIKTTFVQEYVGSPFRTPLYQLKDKRKCKDIYEQLSLEVKKTIDFQTFIMYAGLDEKALSIERNRFLKAIPEKREAVAKSRMITTNNLLLIGERKNEN